MKSIKLILLLLVTALSVSCLKYNEDKSVFSKTNEPTLSCFIKIK